MKTLTIFVAMVLLYTVYAEIASCYDEPCENGGECVKTGPSESDFVCICPVDYTGVTCCTPLSKCDLFPCANGDCDADERCACDAGFTGPDCGFDLCLSNPCQNGGVCSPDTTNGLYMCTCPPGIIGHHCSIDLCNPDPCQNGGTCVPTTGGFYCNCTAGTTGDHCEYDRCADRPVSCDNGGTCDSGSGRCLCADGFSGGNCEISHCDPVCPAGKTCKRPRNAYKCACDSGYTGMSCSDIGSDSSTTTD